MAAATEGGSIILTKLVENPRAVAIVLGHLGANLEIMEHYAKWYTDRSCSVVTGTSPPSRFALNQSLQPTATKILQATARALHGTPTTVPVVVHLFSNGGAFLLEELEVLLQQEPVLPNDPTTTTTSGTTTTDPTGDREASAQTPKPEEEEGGAGTPEADDDTANQQQYALIRTRMQTGYQFFDSCPCYIRMAWDLSGFSQSFPHPTWSQWGRGSYTLAASSCLTLWCTATLSWHRPTRFWQRMLHSRVCLHNVYVYTTMDLATDAYCLEELIHHRRDRLGADCTTLRYEDSNHCRLARDHPEDYQQAINAALEAALQRTAVAAATIGVNNSITT